MQRLQSFSNFQSFQMRILVLSLTSLIALIATTSAVFQVSCPRPTIVESDPALHEWHPVENIFSNVCEHDQKNGMYFLFKNGEVNKSFTIDLGCYVTISSFLLKNTNNGNKGDRGTRRFKIDVSMDSNLWDEVVYGELKNAANFTDCNVPLEEYLVTHQKITKFIRFTAIDFFGLGAGLHHITWRLANDQN